jgi:hypothetical protein
MHDVSNVGTVKRLAIFKLRPRGGGPRTELSLMRQLAPAQASATSSATRNTTAYQRLFVSHQPAPLSFVCFIRPLHSVSFFRSLFGDTLEIFYILGGTVALPPACTS